MSQYTFTTREYGPSAKGSALTIKELDDSLLYLSSSLDSSAFSQSIAEITNELLLLSQSINNIEFHPLSGSNYIFVEANGTPTQNGSYLTASYNIAKTTNPSANDRFSVLLGPGKYEFTSSFILDTEYIDVVSLTGDKDVYITGSNTIVVGVDNVYVKGIDVYNKNFTITGSFPNVIIKNCKGGDESFGGDASLNQNYIIASTFIDCEGGDYSFAGGSGYAYGTFINCIGGEYSFGQYCDGTFTNCVGNNYSFAHQGDIQDGIFENCTGGEDSFAFNGDIGSNSGAPIMKNCTGGYGSFTGGSGDIFGLLQTCKFTSPLDDFSNLTGSIQPPNGAIRECLNANNTAINS
jgi:hypothetical protein